MAKIQIIMNVDEGMMPHVLDHLAGKEVKVGSIEAIGGIPRGMQSGKTSVALSIRLKDGSWVFAETSLKMLQMATAGLTGTYGNETEDPSATEWIFEPSSGRGKN